MAHKLADARKSLLRAKEAANARLVEIEAERKEIKASLRSLDQALKALGGNQRASRSEPSNHDGNEPSQS